MLELDDYSHEQALLLGRLNVDAKPKSDVIRFYICMQHNGEAGVYIIQFIFLSRGWGENKMRILAYCLYGTYLYCHIL